MDEQNIQNEQTNIENGVENTTVVQETSQAVEAQVVNTVVTEKETNVFAIVSMIMGILSLIVCCFNAWVGFFMGILAIVFAIIAKKQGKSGMATAGLTCGIIAACIGLLLGIVQIIIASIFQVPDLSGMDYNELMRFYEQLFSNM